MKVKVGQIWKNTRTGVERMVLRGSPDQMRFWFQDSPQGGVSAMQIERFMTLVLPDEIIADIDVDLDDFGLDDPELPVVKKVTKKKASRRKPARR